MKTVLESLPPRSSFAACVKGRPLPMRTIVKEIQAYRRGKRARLASKQRRMTSSSSAPTMPEPAQALIVGYVPPKNAICIYYLR